MITGKSYHYCSVENHLWLMTHMAVRQEINYDTSRVMPFQDTFIKGMILYLQWVVTGKHHLIVMFWSSLSIPGTDAGNPLATSSIRVKVLQYVTQLPISHCYVNDELLYLVFIMTITNIPIAFYRDAVSENQQKILWSNVKKVWNDEQLF